MAIHPRLEIAKVLTILLASPATPGVGSLAGTWAHFYRLQTGRLFKVGKKAGLRPDRIADVVQSVFVVMLCRWEEYRPHRPLALLKLTGKVMHDRAVDEMRRDDRHRAESLEALPEEPPAGGVSERACMMEATEQRAWLEARLKELEGEDENCALLRAHYLEGRSLAALAAETGYSVAAIKCRITRVLRKLRRLAEKHSAAGKPLS